MSILNIQLGATDTKIITATARSAVFSIIFCNNHSSAIVINISAVPKGVTASESNRIISSYSIPANDSLIWQSGEKFVLDIGDFISGYASTTNEITATVNYLEF